MARLDGTFKIGSIANTDTVFIIAGNTMVSEVLDRFTCGILREAIDRQGQGNPFKRAVILGTGSWKHRSWFTEKCPAISVGGGPANELSKEWIEAARLKNIQPFTLGTGNGVYLSEPRPRAVLYGRLAIDTKAAVESYISEGRGLKEFLNNAWR